MGEAPEADLPQLLRFKRLNQGVGACMCFVLKQRMHVFCVCVLEFSVRPHSLPWDDVNINGQSAGKSLRCSLFRALVEEIKSAEASTLPASNPSLLEHLYTRSQTFSTAACGEFASEVDKIT